MYPCSARHFDRTFAAELAAHNIAPLASQGLRIGRCELDKLEAVGAKGVVVEILDHVASHAVHASAHALRRIDA
jgi:hypothetical protein